MRNATKPALRHALEWSISLALFFIACWILLTYVGEVYRVRQSKQYADYNPGTLLWVNKWHTGARKAFSILHMPYFYIGDGTPTRKYSRNKQLELSRNDLVVFNHVFPDSIAPDVRLRLMSRIIGLPGDTIRIYQGKLYVNGQVVIPSEHTLVDFEAQLTDSVNLTELALKYHLKDLHWTKGLKIRFACHPLKSLDFAGDSLVHRFNRIIESGADQTIFGAEIEDENGDNYGPVVVPWLGMPAQFDAQSLFAQKLWKQHEMHRLTEQVYVNDTIPALSCDYYFVLSDYRKIGNDSRYFGAIPEYLIIGKVAKVLWNPDADPS